MVNIFYTQFTRKLSDESFIQLLLQLTPAMQNQVARYRHWQDAYRNVLGKTLLVTALKSVGAASYSLFDLKFTGLQKPYFEGGPHFNISHSGEFVVCAISQSTTLGIDVEEVKAIPVDDFTGLFSANELADIYHVENEYLPFYKLWTQKEACLKAIGIGLNVPLNKVSVYDSSIVHNGSTWFLSEIELSAGYVCHLCTDVENPPIKVKEVNFY